MQERSARPTMAAMAMRPSPSGGPMVARVMERSPARMQVRSSTRPVGIEEHFARARRAMAVRQAPPRAISQVPQLSIERYSDCFRVRAPIDTATAFELGYLRDGSRCPNSNSKAVVVSLDGGSCGGASFCLGAGGEGHVPQADDAPSLPLISQSRALSPPPISLPVSLSRSLMPPPPPAPVVPTRACRSFGRDDVP